jgi:uncharacterized protein YbjT (DUF2867 family)
VFVISEATGRVGGGTVRALSARREGVRLALRERSRAGLEPSGAELASLVAGSP